MSLPGSNAAHVYDVMLHMASNMTYESNAPTQKHVCKSRTQQGTHTLPFQFTALQLHHCQVCVHAQQLDGLYKYFISVRSSMLLSHKAVCCLTLHKLVCDSKQACAQPDVWPEGASFGHTKFVIPTPCLNLTLNAGVYSCLSARAVFAPHMYIAWP